PFVHDDVEQVAKSADVPSELLVALVGVLVPGPPEPGEHGRRAQSYEPPAPAFVRGEDQQIRLAGRPHRLRICHGLGAVSRESFLSAQSLFPIGANAIDGQTDNQRRGDEQQRPCACDRVPAAVPWGWVSLDWALAVFRGQVETLPLHLGGDDW